jgi:quercetin dioxygenase-like cupin family protein
MIKNETWYIKYGKFEFSWVDTMTTEQHVEILVPGDCVDIFVGQPHQLKALEDDSVVFEVSTEHFDEDSYRIWR